jgi:hypothetical protein
LALRADGTVVVWGNNGYGQNDVPAGLSGVIGIADGSDHCLAIVGNPTPLLLSKPHWQNGVFTVSVPTTAGKTYGLQYKTALTDGTWTALPSVPGNGSIMTLTDTTASSSQRLYRVSEQ